jgi:hypothetical protein
MVHPEDAGCSSYSNSLVELTGTIHWLNSLGSPKRLQVLDWPDKIAVRRNATKDRFRVHSEGRHFPHAQGEFTPKIPSANSRMGQIPPIAIERHGAERPSGINE